jgi:hypothetical protein
LNGSRGSVSNANPFKKLVCWSSFQVLDESRINPSVNTRSGKKSKDAPSPHKISNMKLLSTATLATILLSYVAADVSKVELHQRALKAFSARKSHAFSRELDVSFECITNQNELEDTGVNEPLEDDPDDDQMMDACDIKTKGDRVTAECDYDALGITMIDSDACASAGGSVAKINMEMECDMVSIIMNK